MAAHTGNIELLVPIGAGESTKLEFKQEMTESSAFARKSQSVRMIHVNHQ